MESTQPNPNIITEQPRRSSLVEFREKFLDKLLNTNPHEILNPMIASVEPAKLDPNYPGQDILKSVLQFKATAISNDGTHVDYHALAKDPAFIHYKTRIAPALQSFEPEKIVNHFHKIAFWVNLYNALIIDAVITFNIEKSVTENFGILRFFRRAAYNIGGQRLSAEDIEHGIIRSNQGHPFIPGRQFANNDERRKWAIRKLEPRIHFALNCASQSCPTIGFYSPESADLQLDIAARNFIEHETTIEPAKNRIIISKIFQWYAVDFGGRAGILNYLLNYLPESDARVWLENNQKTARIQYSTYNWKLNT